MGTVVGTWSSVTGGRGPSRFLELVLVAAATVYTVSLLPGVRPGGPGYVPLLDFGLSCAVLLLAAACCALRAVRDAAERAAWAATALALAVYTCGDVYLHELGCDVVQGYHLARPMRPEQMIGWLEERSGAPRVVAGSGAIV